MNVDDTIVAIATPPGRGGIGVVRLAGPRALDIAKPFLRLKHAMEPGRAVFGELIEPGGDDAELRLGGELESSTELAKGATAPTRIDEVVVTVFCPATFLHDRRHR